MARGWESKQVEAQIESAREAQHVGSAERSTDGQQRERERQTLLLSRAYIQRQIESSANSRYTEALNKALEEIDRKLATLSEARNGSSGESQTP
jgi:ribosomal protein L20